MDKAIIETEVNELHAFFVAWFGGTCERSKSLFDATLRSRIHPSCVLVSPGGTRTGGNELLAMIRAAYGSNPLFRIEIRNLEMRIGEGPYVLATYEEWQRNAINSTPSDNGRLSSALFAKSPDAPRGLQWFHIHETWLPADVIASANYEF